MEENVKQNFKEEIEGTLQGNISHLPKYKKYLVVTDENENVKGYFPLKNKGLGKDWIALYQNAIMQVAKEKLTGEQSSVFLYLLGQVDFENYLTVNQTQVAEDLDMHRVNVTKAIKKLKDLDIIMEGPRAGLNKTYRLNPYIGHKGTNREQTVKDYESEQTKRNAKITKLEPK